MKVFLLLMCFLFPSYAFAQRANPLEQPQPQVEETTQETPQFAASEFELRDTYHAAQVEAAHNAWAAGLITRAEYRRFRRAMLAPAFRDAAKELALVQMAFSDEEGVPRDASGAIQVERVDWPGLTAFLEALMPWLIKLLEMFLGGGALLIGMTLVKPVDETFGLAKELVKNFGYENVGEYAKRYNIPDDEANITSHLANRFCAVPDHVGVGPQEASWPRTCMEPTFAYRFSGMNLSQTEIATAMTMAFAVINKMSAAKIKLIGDDLTQAKIWATTGPLNGSTLAWSFLPNGSCADRLEQRYDTSSRTWSLDMLARVIVHECLHAMGLEHSNDQRDIMYPSIHPTKTLADYPGPGDVARMVAFYGPFVPTPDDPPPTDPGDDEFELRTVRLAVSMRNAIDQFLSSS